MTANASHAGTGGNSWIYEIRGSSIYDLVSDQPISIFDAAERLNRNLMQAGIWAAKAGRAEAANHALAAEVQRLRTALEPVAALIDVLPDATQIIHRDEVPFYSFDGVELTYGDARRARAALDAPRSE